MLYRNITDQILFGVKPLGVINVASDQQDFGVIWVGDHRVHTFVALEGEPITSPLDIKLPVDYEKMKDILNNIGIPLENDQPDHLIQQWIAYSVTEPVPYDLTNIPEEAQPLVNKP